MKEHPYTTVAIHHQLLSALDQLVGAEMARGARPRGRAPSRGTVVATLIEQAAKALQQPQSVTPSQATPQGRKAPREASRARA